MSTFLNMYKAEKENMLEHCSLFFFCFKGKKKYKLQILRRVFEIEKVIMQNNLDKRF